MTVQFAFDDEITIKDILSSNYIFVNITKDICRSKSYKYITNILKKFEKIKTAGRNKMLLLFAYDDVPEEIYEIPEIREWVSKLVKKYPHIFYFLSSEMQNKQLIYACLVNLTSVGNFESKTTYEWMVEGRIYPDVPKKAVLVGINKKIQENIVKGVIEYGLKIEDSMDNILMTLLDLPYLGSVEDIINAIPSSDLKKIVNRHLKNK